MGWLRACKLDHTVSPGGSQPWKRPMAPQPRFRPGRWHACGAQLGSMLSLPLLERAAVSGGGVSDEVVSGGLCL